MGAEQCGRGGAAVHLPFSAVLCFDTQVSIAKSRSTHCLE